MEESNQLRKPSNRPLKNVNCPYCGIVLERDNTIKEHVVGRRFVPKGKFDGNWNLILQACGKCNEEKSNLEDDISAISLLLPWAMVGEDEAFANDVLHKAKKSNSRRTRKHVADSSETIVHQGSFGQNVSFSATMVSPPQIDQNRAFELAWFQLAGFFYLLTYNQAECQGVRWPGGCLPLAVVLRSDWGNSVQCWFMETVKSWYPRIIGPMAAGFYRIAIRRHPEAEVWSWALEWNKTIRVIGFFGDEDTMREIVQIRPEMPMHVMSSSGSDYLRIRIEVPLEEESDILFDGPDIAD
jgi:hypothetical protein